MFYDQWCVLLKFENGRNIVVGPFSESSEAQKASEHYKGKMREEESKIGVEPILAPAKDFYSVPEESEDPNQLVMEFGDPVVGESPSVWEEDMLLGQDSIDTAFHDLKARLIGSSDQDMTEELKNQLHASMAQAAAFSLALDDIHKGLPNKDLGELLDRDSD